MILILEIGQTNHTAILRKKKKAQGQNTISEEAQGDLEFAVSSNSQNFFIFTKSLLVCQKIDVLGGSPIPKGKIDQKITKL